MELYRPMMPDAEVARRKTWQEKVYRKLKEVTEKRTVNFLGRTITVLPGMFAPVFEDSTLLARFVTEEVKEDDSVLDLGTGTGIQGIMAAAKARRVMAVDINRDALDCARINVENNHLSRKIEILYSDLFSNIDERFDLILFNPPFRWFKPRDMLERGELDENYATLNRYFKEVGNYLKTGGRILMVFSTSGDMKYLEHLISESGFISEVLVKSDCDGWEYRVFRLNR